VIHQKVDSDTINDRNSEDATTQVFPVRNGSTHLKWAHEHKSIRLIETIHHRSDRSTVKKLMPTQSMLAIPTIPLLTDLPLETGSTHLKWAHEPKSIRVIGTISDRMIGV
jgi:hypothetical protein